MTQELKLGMIGLDTSHAIAFAELLNDPANEYHVPGGRIVAAYPGTPSMDFEMSCGRLEKFTNELHSRFGVRLEQSPEAVAATCDAVFLESVDGRVHLDLFQKIAPFGKPVFIDKPVAVSFKDARSIVDSAIRYNVPVMSCSSLRYAEALYRQLEVTDKGEIIGADFFGPMPLQPTQPGLFWYGIHTVEMLYAALGKGCVQVSAAVNEEHEVIVGVWADGRIGTIRGNRRGNASFGGTIHREKGSGFVDVGAYPKPYYASMLERIMDMFRTGRPPIEMTETLEIVCFIEAANESRMTGKSVKLSL